MDSNEKIFIGAGVLAIGVVIFLAYQKQKRQQQITYLNQPGLVANPTTAANIGASEVILSASDAASSWISNLISGNSSTPSEAVQQLNQPGLEAQDESAFPGMEYTYDNSNSYAVSPNDPSVTTDESVPLNDGEFDFSEVSA